MNSRRDAILREMGLAPIWRERRPDKPAPTEGGTPSGAHSTMPCTSLPAVSAGGPGTAREAQILALDWSGLQAAVRSCTACGLHKARTQTVFGTGDARADWLLVGEAPGAEEDRLGEPFVGQAGRLLDNMLAAIGLARGANVYIANVLKCRPPGNRNPEAEEVARCTPHLLRQIDLIQPRLIVAMGRFAAQTLLGTDASIASLRGRVHSYRSVPLIVTYHPAYLLRNLPDKAKAWQDLLFAVQTMADLQSRAGVPT